MPGAPNRPPEIASPSAGAAVPDDEAARRLLRRLGPMRVALHLDLWKGAPSPELVHPLELAEANFASGDVPTASGHLDQLAVRFAEPRWPTLPLPFRGLRVSIPAPQPPQWDPEHALPPAEKESRRLQRDAELQRDLARATLEWGAKHGVDLSELSPLLDEAVAAIGPPADPAFFAAIDRFWQGVRQRVPMPKPSGRPSAAPAERPVA